MKNIPVYKHPAAYAREHDELAVYRASNQANAACKEAIEAAITIHNDKNDHKCKKCKEKTDRCKKYMFILEDWFKAI